MAYDYMLLSFNVRIRSDPLSLSYYVYIETTAQMEANQFQLHACISFKVTYTFYHFNSVVSVM